MYVDVVYCYRPSSVVWRSVCLSHCQRRLWERLFKRRFINGLTYLLTYLLVSPAKTAEPIEMPFGLRTWVSPENHALDAGPETHGKWQFSGEGASHWKVQEHSAVICAKTTDTIEMLFGFWPRIAPWNHLLDGHPDSPREGAILGERGAHCKVQGLAEHKKLNRSICHNGLRTRVGQRKHNFNRIRQVVPMCRHGRAYWRHLANTIKLSICGGDAVLCQIILTTC